MPVFLFSANSPDGRQVTERIEAATADAARYALDLRGYREIAFHTDDASNRMDAVFQAEMVDGHPDSQLTPEQELEARQGGGMLQVVWSAWKHSAVFWVPLGLWVGVSLAGGRPFSWLDILSFALGALFLGWFVWLVLPGVGYQGLLAASTWNRLRETRAWVRFLRFLSSVGAPRTPQLELDMRLACVLARNGCEEEARRVVAPHEAAAAGNPMILGRLAGFYEAVGDHARAHANRTLAVEASGGGLAEIIDHAHGLVRHLRRPAEARASLARIADREVADLAQIFVRYTDGLIALEEGRPEAAIELLSKTEQAMTPYEGNELVKGMFREVWAFRVIALAATGQFAEAKQLFAKALPLLRARRESSLIARCLERLPRSAGPGS